MKYTLICAYCGDEVECSKEIYKIRSKIPGGWATGSHKNCSYPWTGTVGDIREFKTNYKSKKIKNKAKK